MVHKQLGDCTFDEAKTFAKRNKCRLPTAEEWNLIIENMPAIAQKITDLKGKHLFKQFYWCGAGRAGLILCTSSLGREIDMLVTKVTIATVL